MKKDNMLLTFLWVGYVLVSLLAVVFGYLNYQNNVTTYNTYIFLSILVLAILMVIIYFVSVKNSQKKAKVIRNVYIDKTKVVNGNNNKVSIVHVDEVESSQIIVSVYKNKEVPTDVIGAINNDN